MKKTFAEWMNAVEAILERRLGLSSADLSDCCYSDWYEDGMSPGEAATHAIHENE